MADRSGYSGGRLQSLFSVATVDPPTRKMLRATADDTGAFITKRAREMTPVGRTGRTRASLQQIDTHRVPDGFRSGVQSHYWIARLVEHGVSGHQIRPKGTKGRRAISTPEGPRAGARSPGFAGRHMVSRAVGEAEAAWPELAAPHLATWVIEVENTARSHDGVA